MDPAAFVEDLAAHNCYIHKLNGRATYFVTGPNSAHGALRNLATTLPQPVRNKSATLRGACAYNAATQTLL